MDHLGVVLKGLFSDGSLPFTLDDLKIWDLWKEVVGPVVADSARPFWIRNGILRVMVSDSIWLQELQFQEEGIREGLNRRLGRSAVVKVEFRVRLR